VKALFILLLVANLAVAGYAWYASQRVNPDAQLLHQQLNADKIHVIAPRPMVTARPKPAACLEWGTFGAQDIKAVQSALDGLNLGSRLTSREVPVQVGFWVYIQPLRSKAELDRKILELEKLGVHDYFAIETAGPMKYAISLGVFRTEDAANNYLETLRQRGVRSARTGVWDHRVTQTAFLIRDPDVPLTARLAELQKRFPGSDLKALDCP